MQNNLESNLDENWIRKSCNKSQTVKHSFFNPKYVKFIDAIKRKSICNYNNQELNLKQIVTKQLPSINKNTLSLSTTERTLNNREFSDKNLIDIHSKTMELINKKEDDKFLRNLLFNKCKIKNYFTYIHKIQKYLHDECSYKVKFRGRLSTKEIEIDEFNNDIELLSFVIARYCIIIFYLMKKQKMDEAKKILLLMIKENLIYFQYFQNSFYNFILRNLRHLQSFNTKKIPNKVFLLLKFYQVILKYSAIFNITKLRDFILGRYLSLHFLNYFLFELRCQIRNYTTDTRNHVKYFYSQCLYNASYYCIYNYTSMKIPLTLCNKILNIYNDIEEETFTIREKNLLINASFNKSLYLYISEKNELALNQFELTKKKLFSFYKNKDVDNEFNENHEEESSNVNSIINKNILRQSSRLILQKHTLSNKLIIKRQDTLLKRKNALRNDDNLIDDIKKLVKNSDVRLSLSQNDHQKIFDILFTNINGKLKNNLTMEDIKTLIFLNVKDIKDQEYKNRKNSVVDFDKKNLMKFQKNFGVSQNKNDANFLKNLRESNINYKKLLNIQKLNIPKYLQEPLLIEIELLMCEIELDKNNYKNAYEHIKNSVLIIFVQRQINDTVEKMEKRNEYLKKYLNILSIFLSKIENLAYENRNNFTKNTNKNNIRNTRTVRLSKSIRSLFMNRNYDSQDKNDNFAKNIKRKLSMIALSNLKIDNQQNYKNYVNQKINLELEKFFIFLNSLSIYQIKVLNETQPKKEDHNEIRNYLPLVFSSEFLNTLTLSQKNSLDLIHTMSFTRNAVLYDPKKFIAPSNLKLSSLAGGIFWNNIKIPKKKIEENYKVYKNIENGISTKHIPKTKEFLYIKTLFMNNNNNYQQFLVDNYSLIIKIFKKLNDKEIEGILNEPEILIDSVNEYKTSILGKLILNENGNDNENEIYQNEINLLVSLKGYKSVSDFFKSISEEKSRSKEFIEISLSESSNSNEDEDEDENEKNSNGLKIKNKNEVSFVSNYIEAD